MRTSRILQAVEAHAGGAPGRVITGGMPLRPGNAMLEKMQDMAANHEEIHLQTLREPRGNPGLCGNTIVPPCHPEADAGFIIFEPTEYPPMPGANTVCVVTVLLKTGVVPMTAPVTELVLEARVWLVRVCAECRDGKVTRVEFKNVPAFAVHLDAPVEAAGLGTVRVDAAWGGMFFVLAEAEKLDVALDAGNGAEILRVSEAIRHAAARQLPVVHPDNPGITGTTITNLWSAPVIEDTDGRGAITSRPAPSPRSTRRTQAAFMSVRPAAPAPAPGWQCCMHAGCWDRAASCDRRAIGHHFYRADRGENASGPYKAIVPPLSGQGWTYGLSSYTLDLSTPFPEGYTVGGMW
ncbi:proline racemase family protein [Leisingera methylohalidivorans]|uniref:proline racemase family protein n=1 Tax=Leisingera methylohalidivorans TaxID=133924 RepID=UPI00040434A1|nr:proline racemase family protein [Leisingera methylohalidivorans]